MNPVHEPMEDVTIENNSSLTANGGSPFTITTFNIGYGGLDQSQDFFADGGTRSRAESLGKVHENLNAAAGFIKENDSDFYLIQEIDRKASRSFDVEQFDFLKSHLSDYSASFAYNYNAIWVPIPLKNPMGYANAGLGNFTKYRAEKTTRHEFEGQESWPTKLGELDRCMMQTDIPLENGKTLSIINAHLSAYDEGGLLRGKQVDHLIRHMNALYEAGHYVVIGGDWNQLLIQSESYGKDLVLPEWLVRVPETLTASGFKWAYDEKVNTVRDLATLYEAGVTFETVIDGFLVSPNVEILEVKGHDLKFEHSDHNPVTLTFKFTE